MIRIAALIAVLTAPALADGLLPVHEIRYATYDCETQQIVPVDSGLRARRAVWNCSRTIGLFSGFRETQVWMDWGDIQSPSQVITEFEVAYATDSSAPFRLDMVFWRDENGFNSRSRQIAGVTRLHNLPGGTSGFGTYTGWIISAVLDPANRFQFRGADLDADGLGDFGYSFNFRDIGDGHGGVSGHERFGPFISPPDPNLVSSCPGADDGFDRFSDDPQDPPGPNDLRNPSSMIFDGTFWFSHPYAQFYLVLFTDSNLLDAGACNQPGCGGADIDPAPGLPFGGGDCAIGLGDLAVLLGNFGTTAGATYADGDVEPASTGDGDVDLGDLSVLLAAFGADCR